MEEKKTVRTVKTETVHNLIMESRRKMSVSGVTDVESFNEDEIVLITGMGALIVKGGNLHINKLSVDSGEVSLEGEIDSLCYAQTGRGKGAGILSRMFK